MSEILKEEVRINRHFDVSPDRVFDAWTDPRMASTWLFATPQGQRVRVEIDSRVGGKFVFVDRRGGEDIEHVGEYLEIARPTLLVFNFWVPKFTKEKSHICVEILPSEKGCDVTVIHSGVFTEYSSQTKEGWTRLLANLALKF